MNTSSKPSQNRNQKETPVNTPLSVPSSRPLSFLHAALVAMALLLFATTVAQAVNVTWSDGSGDDLWSSPGNWTGGLPAGNSVYFTNTGTAASPGTVTSIVNGNTTIGILHFQNFADHTVNPNMNYHTIHINDGITLTVNNHLRVGDSGSSRTTWARIEGAGTLDVNAPASSIVVDYNGSYWQQHPSELDLSGLATFTANVATINLGPSNPYASASPYATLRLAQDSYIKANSVIVSGNQHQYGYLYLNEDTTIHADTLSVAQGGYRQGYIYFASGLTSPTVTIRGKSGGDTRADLLIANGNGGKSTAARVDFTGGTVDALLNHVAIGVTDGGAAGYEIDANGRLVLAAGTIDANTVVIAQAVPTTLNGRSAIGTLDLNGGTFRAGTLTLGDFQTGSGTIGNGGVTATVNLTAGILQVGLLQGGEEVVSTPTRIFNWSDGTIQNLPALDTTITNEIPLKLLTSATHTFLVDAAQSMTVNSSISGVSGTGGILKSGDGVLTLAASNSYTGGTQVSAGTLIVGHANALGTTGTIAVAADAMLALADGVNFLRPVTWNDGATIAGTGTRQTGGDWILPANFTLTPGFSTGTLTIDVGAGNTLAMNSTTTTEIEIADLADFDILAIIGNAELAGTLSVTLLDGYRPAYGTTFDVITTTEAMTGLVDLGGLDGIWFGAAIVDGNILRLTSLIPEPTSAVLLAFAGLAMFRRSKRG